MNGNGNGNTRRRPRLLVVTLALALIAGALAVLSAPQAQAATNLGSLVFTPQNGTTSDIVQATTVSSGTPKGCPSETLTVVGRLTGPGAWASGIIAISRLDSGISTTDEFTVGLSDTLGGLATSNGLQFAPGDYTLTLRCQNLSNTIYGEFTGTLTFTDATHYTSTAPTQATSTTLAVSPAGSAQVGAEVTLTATVSPAAAGGTVQFKDGANNLGSPVAVTGGTATLKTSALTQGAHSLGASFTPSSSAYSASAATPVSYTVNAAPATPTTTTLAVTPSGSAQAGAEVTLTATVSPAAAGGAVQFKDGATNLGGAVAVAGGVASLKTTTLVQGSHTLSAVFTPTSAATYTGSTSNTVSYNVTAPPPVAVDTTTTLAATPVSGAKAGDPVTLTASVLPATATGTVQFTDTVSGSTTNVGTPVAVTAGSASLSTTALTAATHSLKAVFTPADAAAYKASTSSALSYVVSPAVVPPTSTTTALTVTPVGGSSVGDPVTLTAAVSPAAATGTVQFSDGASALGTPVTVTGGSAALTTSALSAATHSLKAVFTPANAAAYTGSTSSTVTYVVSPKAGPVATALTLAATPSGTAVAGTSVTFTATVAPSAAGTVTFTQTPSGGTSSPIGSPVTVSGGKATVSLSTLAVGTYSIGAAFAPADATAFQASTASPLAYTITAPPTQPTATTTTLAGAPAGPVKAGTKVTLTATVSPSAATGSVQFVDTLAGTSTPLGTGTVTGGKATLETTFTATGAHALTAVFSPSDVKAYLGSTSAAVAYQVNPADGPQAKATSVKFTVLRIPFLGNGAVLIAEVKPSEAAGTVQFTDTRDGKTVAVGGPVKVYNGYAILWTGVSPGKHLGTATFTPADPAKYLPSVSNQVAVDGGRG